MGKLILIDADKLKEAFLADMKYFERGTLMDCIMKWIMYEIDTFPPAGEWIPVGERLPENEKEVEVSIERRLENGTRRFTCRAIYEDGNIWSENSLYHWDDLGDYDEKRGDGKVPQGWYEAATYAEEFAVIGDFVVAWRPLPEPYQPPEESEVENADIDN